MLCDGHVFLDALTLWGPPLNHNASSARHRISHLAIRRLPVFSIAKRTLRHRQFSEVAAPCTCPDRQPRGVTLTRFRRALSISQECHRIVLFDLSLLSGQSRWRGEAGGDLWRHTLG